MTTPTLDRHHGLATSYDVVMPGFNARLDEIRAALLRAQLSRLPEFLELRRAHRRTYLEALRDTVVTVPFARGRFSDELDDTGVHIMPVILPEGCDRLDVMARMQAAGIQTSIHYPPIHRFVTYAPDHVGQLVRTGQLADRELTLPFFPTMTTAQIHTVVETLLEAVVDRCAPSKQRAAG
jgi:dTDP-4-amino-4,6-dideoxygalactose transaminase